MEMLDFFVDSSYSGHRMNRNREGGPVNLTEQQKERYSRHLIMPEIGAEGQEKLLAAKVLVIGAGGLGSPVLTYLAAAGVGTLGIADGDVVSLSNLQRQILYTTDEIGRPKVECAKRRLSAMNPDVTFELYPDYLTPETIGDVIAPYDMVVDCVDSFPVKYLINDTCAKMGKPFVHGGILGLSGQVLTVLPGTACFRCFFRDPPPDEVMPEGPAGVVGVTPGILGTLQAAEVIKYLTGVGSLLTNTLLVVHAEDMEFARLELPGRIENCPACGNAEN